MPDVTLVNVVFPTPVTASPLGLLCLASSLEQAGYDVEVRDYQHCPGSDPAAPETLAAFAVGDSPVVGLSAMSYALPLIVEAARLMKRDAPRRRIVVGGIGPSGAAGRLLTACPEIDVVVVGEGETTFVELVDHLRRGEDLDLVTGIVFGTRDGPVATPPRPRIRDLSTLPAPSWSHVDLRRYRIVDVQFGRGCPFACSFCDIAPYWGRRHTERPVEPFLDELARVRELGARDVFVVDDTFVLRRRVVKEICDGIRDRGLDLSWGCYARTDLVDEPLIADMADAGCQKIFYGVESGSGDVLGGIAKNIDLARTREAVRLSLEYLRYVTVSFVWGFPTETFDDLVETVSLLLYFTALGAAPQLNRVLPYSFSSLTEGHRDGLSFDPGDSSQLAFYGSRAREVAALVRRDPQLYSAFHQLPTPEAARKLAFLEDTGVDPRTMQDAYFGIAC